MGARSVARRRPGPGRSLDGMADLPTGNLMQPTLVSKPFHREGWIWEEKYDGWRMLAY
jgi:hypothetical protein